LWGAYDGSIIEMMMTSGGKDLDEYLQVKEREVLLWAFVCGVYNIPTIFIKKLV
jgi:hypothetical protein